MRVEENIIRTEKLSKFASSIKPKRNFQKIILLDIMAEMKNNVLLKVLLAIGLAILAGWWVGPEKEIFGITFVRIFGLMGQLFLNALTLVVVPLVAASIITGTARMGAERSFGLLGAKTFGFYVGITSLAVLTGLFIFLLISPGEGVTTLAADASKIADIAKQSQGDTFERISQILMKLIPSNILAVAAQGQMLGLIFFCMLFGFFLPRIEPHPSSVVLGFWQGIFQIMMRITHLVMRALPFGVFGLVAKVIATTGAESIAPVIWFCITFLGSLLLFALVVLPIILTLAGINPFAYIRALSPALITAFSTSSSAATLPLTIECVEKRAGISNRICSFAVPLGTSLSLSGSALYTCVASLFIAQVYGADLAFTQILTVVLLAILCSVGMAGIPSASLISVVLILQTLGVPAEGVGLIMAVERVLDMCRTVVNVFGNACCAALVARLEGEQFLSSTPQQKAV